MEMNWLNKKIVIKIEFAIQQLIQSSLVVLLFAYLSWELYWFSKIGLYFIKWHTHIAFTTLLFGAIISVPLTIASKFLLPEKRKDLLTVGISLLLTITAIELFLMATGWNKAYSEIRWSYYQSPFEPDKSNTYHIYSPNDSSTSKSVEFGFTIHHNSLGFVGSAWQPQKDSIKTRIITIGDSFTEGDGAPTDSSYPALIQQILGKKFDVLNAGVRGSDPVFGVKNLEDRLLTYKPDVVVQAVSENDVLFDMCIRGGYERFFPDSTVHFSSPPWWEPIYAISYTARIFFHAFGLDMQTPCGSIRNPIFIANQTRLLQDVFDRYEKLGAANNISILIVFYPTKFEVFRNAYSFDFSASKKYINTLKHVQYVDLFPCYRSTIKTDGKKAETYYWKIDGHHNPTGYRMMAQCIAEAVKPLAQ